MRRIRTRGKLRKELLRTRMGMESKPSEYIYIYVYPFVNSHVRCKSIPRYGMIILFAGFQAPTERR